MYWNPDVLKGVCTVAHKARDFVVVRFKNLFIVSVYILPNVRNYRFLELLDSLGDFLCFVQGEIIVCGDFNAKSVLWGCSANNNRGDYLEN